MPPPMNQNSSGHQKGMSRRMRRQVLLDLLAASPPPGHDLWTYTLLGEHIQMAGPAVRRLVRRMGIPTEKIDGSRSRRPVTRSPHTERLLELVQSPPPDGVPRWTLVGLRKQLVAEGRVTYISRERIRQILEVYGLSTRRAESEIAESGLPA